MVYIRRLVGQLDARVGKNVEQPAYRRLRYAPIRHHHTPHLGLTQKVRERVEGTTLARGLLPTLRSGAVVLLHDGPDAGRSARTLDLLEVLLPALSASGLEPVTLAELGPRPIGWRAGWARLRAMWLQPPRAHA